jgi:hypothetical protein
VTAQGKKHGSGKECKMDRSTPLCTFNEESEVDGGAPEQANP